jgi:hypothetical protein
MGKPKHSNDRRGEQKGAQQHDEGQYGPKAFEAKFAEISSHGGSRRQSERATTDPNRGGRRGDQQAALHEQELSDPSMRDGRHRLAEERKQHDEADRAQAKNRLVSDIEVHGHDRSRFQVPGGRTRHPQGPDAKGKGIHSPGESGK